jgi:hypothetical protein
MGHPVSPWIINARNPDVAICHVIHARPKPSRTRISHPVVDPLPGQPIIW